MTENRRRAPRPLSTGDVLILSIVVGVFLGAAFLAGAILWNELNPSQWTAGGWAAVGAWVAGVATFCAVLVALTDSTKTRKHAQKSIDAAEARAEQALWAARRDREIGILTELRLPVRAMCVRLTKIEDQLTKFDELDMFFTDNPLPAISSESARMIETLDDFVANYELHAYGSVEAASMVVTVPTVKSIVDDMYEELNQLDSTIKDWQRVLRAQGAPDLSATKVSRAAILLGQLDEVRARVDDAYPVLMPV
ncbi:hypothetical protein KZO37_16030 [Rhodococcus fascians]|uniref:hypothetical protein n=1 Tax=Rhodococcoides fascians TaxID=1828 RepID=UPI001C5F7D09|nr:hypothetical protein [Rhodococcus fascians]MBW4780876.1 hypothetical protein [Rhodococcus fascians]